MICVSLSLSISICEIFRSSADILLLPANLDIEDQRAYRLPVHSRWPHIHADQVRGLSLREMGGGFAKHHRAPSVRAACYAIAKPSTMLQNMEIKKRLRGHQNAVYCGMVLTRWIHLVFGIILLLIFPRRARWAKIL